MTPCVFTGIGRVVAIADLHGNYPGFRRILRETGILDRRGRWQARDTHLVQLGDILGRGGEPGKIFALLMRMEREAPRFGSRVHVLLGNHEAMSMSGHLVYNTLEEFQDLADQDLLEARASGTPPRPDADRDRPGRDPEADPESPAEAKLGKRLDMLGCREFRAALSSRGKVGRWLRTHDSAVSVNGSLFVHGGLDRRHGCMPLEALNERVREALADDGAPAQRGGIALRRDGPQWNREFALKPDEERRRELEEVLAYHGCDRMVVGHTPTSRIDPARAGRIVPMHADRLYCIDTGIGKTYGGHLSALSLERGSPSALYF